MNSHFGQNSSGYECPDCREVFTRKYSMTRHQKTACRVSRQNRLVSRVDMLESLVQDYQDRHQAHETIHKTVVKNVINTVVNHVEDRYFNAVIFEKRETDDITVDELIELIKKRCPNVPWTDETILKITYPESMPECSIVWVYEPDYRKMEPVSE